MLQLPPRSVIALLVVLVLVCAALPVLPDAIAGPYAVKFVTRIVVTAIMVLSLDLLIGITGLVSFGHAAFFGIGAYAVYFVSPEADSANAFVAFPLAVALAGAAAAIVGAFAVRTKGFYFIMVTLAASQMLYALFHDTKIAGGSDGASINIKPDALIGETSLLDLSSRAGLLWLSLGLLVLVYIGALALVRSPFGRVLQGIRWNEERMRALGFDTYLYKLAIFTIAGAIAGLAGALFASIDGFVPPELLGWRQSGLAIMMVVLGGTGTLYGAALGAIIYNLLEEGLKNASLVGGVVADHWPIAMGLVLIAAVLAAPEGVAGWLPARRSIWRARAEEMPTKLAPAPRLAVAGLGKRFGGLVANDGITLAFAPNRIHAIIGPNGAGKTTFTNLLSGLFAPSAGKITLGDDVITRLPMHRRARLGIGRSFQRTNIVPAFTVAENCRVAAQAGGQGDAAVTRALDLTGLADRCDRPARELSHGEQRQLEIAMLLASGARLLLLDEPLAGAGPEETQRLTALLRGLSTDHTILLIEHDMDAVFAVADTISVLVNGRLIAHGTPDEIRADEAVRGAYLGHFEPKEQAA